MGAQSCNVHWRKVSMSLSQKDHMNQMTNSILNPNHLPRREAGSSVLVILNGYCFHMFLFPRFTQAQQGCVIGFQLIPLLTQRGRILRPHWHRSRPRFIAPPKWQRHRWVDHSRLVSEETAKSQEMQRVKLSLDSFLDLFDWFDEYSIPCKMVNI